MCVCGSQALICLFVCSFLCVYVLVVFFKRMLLCGMFVEVSVIPCFRYACMRYACWLYCVKERMRAREREIKIWPIFPKKS